MEEMATDAEGMLRTLILAGDEAIERHRDRVADVAH